MNFNTYSEYLFGRPGLVPKNESAKDAIPLDANNAERSSATFPFRIPP